MNPMVETMLPAEVRRGVFVVVPAFNVAPAIGEVLRELGAVYPNVVMDDGSTDGAIGAAGAAATHLLRHARVCFAELQDRSNGRRPHWALVPEQGGDPVAPRDVYVGGVKVTIPKWQDWAQAAGARLEEMMAA